MNEQELLQETQGRKEFSNEIPGLQVAWDATSLNWLKRCPEFYRRTMIQGLQHKMVSRALVFGRIYHECLELYDKLRAYGENHESSLKQAAAKAYNETMEWNEDKGLYEPVLLPEGDSYRNRETLIRAVVWYCEEHQDDNLQTLILSDGSAACELSFRFQTKHQAPSGEPFILCGHIDKIVEMGEELFVLDHKTTKGQLGDGFFQGFSPDNQISLYSLGGQVVLDREISGVIIAGTQLGASFNRFHRRPIQRTQRQLNEWYDDLGQWFRLAEHWAMEGHWPKNDAVCGLYGGCVFRGVCGRDPVMRQGVLDSEFQRRDWQPLEVR